MATWTVPARAVRVVAVDIVVLDIHLGWKVWRMSERCRLAGINAPELSTAEGVRAAEWLRSILPPGTAVTFVSSSLDKYGRPLGHVVCRGGHAGEEMVVRGYAQRA